MMLAQQLYEGITFLKKRPCRPNYLYKSTDSVHLASVAVAEIRNYIGEVYGDAYLPPKKPNVYSSRKNAQGGP